jgi:hypothetical protein
MPLEAVHAQHTRVVCHACGEDAHLCLGVGLRELAVTRFRAAGWSLDTASGGRSRGSDYAEKQGNGRWYCPKCSTRAKKL